MKRATDAALNMLALWGIKEWLGFEVAVLLGISLLASILVNPSTK